jgi:hypothetical protein
LDCALGGHPSAKNPTRFQRSGVAIHSGNTNSPPQSHGCARTSVSISELIHDNVIVGKTMIASSGTWSGTTCYNKKDVLVPRKDACDGNKLKAPKAKASPKGNATPKFQDGGSVPKGNTKQPSPVDQDQKNLHVPVAQSETENDNEVAFAYFGLADGPGQDNGTGDAGPSLETETEFESQAIAEIDSEITMASEVES